MPRAAPSLPLRSGPKWGGGGAGKQPTPEWALSPGEPTPAPSFTRAEGLEVPWGMGQVPQSSGTRPSRGRTEPQQATHRGCGALRGKRAG